MTAALCTLDVAGGLNQPLRRDISAPADPVDRRDCQARDAGQHSTHASGDGSCDATLLGARSGTRDGRSHRDANAGRDASGGRAQAQAEARAKVLRLVVQRHLVSCCRNNGLLYGTTTTCCRRERINTHHGDVIVRPIPKYMKAYAQWAWVCIAMHYLQGLL